MGTQGRKPSPGDPSIDFQTLDLLPYGVIVLDDAGTVLYYNDREQEIAGRRREAVLGRDFFRDIAPCTAVQEFLGPFGEALRGQGRLPAFRFQFPFTERVREVEITLTGFAHEGKSLCLVSVNDLTEQEQLRQRILQTERLSEVGEAAAGIAHNFNNLLQVILGNAQRVERELGTGHALAPRLARIVSAADDGAQVVARILDSARQTPEQGEPRTVVDVRDVARQALAFAEEHARAGALRGAKIELESRLGEQPLLVSADPTQLREVALNLMRNAIDAVPSTGTVTVATSRDPSGQILLAIEDTGAGMTPEVMARIFRPLFTTKGASGTGLGLATCWAIARRHRGYIDVTSAPDRGSRFTLVLPPAP